MLSPGAIARCSRSVLAVTAVALLWRHRSPLVVLGVALTVAATLNCGPIGVLPTLLAVFTVAESSDRSRMLIASLVTSAVIVLTPIAHGGSMNASGVASRLIAVGLAVSIGLYLRARADFVVGLQERAERLERERELLAQQAVSEERLRIARELHDVVAHNVSLMVVQSQALAVRDDEPEQQHGLGQIAGLGREALSEMHRMLGVLRLQDGGQADRAPQPGVRDLETLIERTRGAGLDTQLVISGEPQDLPPGIDLSAYRILQEALTNVVRHAHASHAVVRLSYAPDLLDVSIEDDGVGVTNGAVNGHGLVGMRERWPSSAGASTPLSGMMAADIRSVRRYRCVEMPELRILIADDQPLMRAGFRAVLEATGDMEVVAEAENGREAVSAARAARPDVILMDIRMPELDGIEAIRQLPGHRVLVLTTFGLDDYIVDALRAGASGFLTKDVPADELVRAVRVVAAGDALLTPGVTRQLLDRVARRLPAPVTAGPGALADLTERELEVLELLARGMSNAEIAEALIVGDATVKTHVSNVLMKLGLRDRVQAVVLAYGIGLVQPGSAPSDAR